MRCAQIRHRALLKEIAILRLDTYICLHWQSIIIESSQWPSGVLWRFGGGHGKYVKSILVYGRNRREKANVFHVDSPGRISNTMKGICDALGFSIPL